MATTKVIRTVRPRIAEPRLVRHKPVSIIAGVALVEEIQEREPIPEGGTPEDRWHAIFEVEVSPNGNGRSTPTRKSVAPEEAERLLASGEAELDDAEAAQRDVDRLRSAARVPFREQARYQRAVQAFHTRRMIDALQRACEIAGISVGDDVVPGTPHLFTPEDMCRIFSISERTLARWDGIAIPKSLKFSGTRRWLAHAVIASIQSRT